MILTKTNAALLAPALIDGGLFFQMEEFADSYVRLASKPKEEHAIKAIAMMLQIPFEQPRVVPIAKTIDVEEFISAGHKSA